VSGFGTVDAASETDGLLRIIAVLLSRGFTVAPVFCLLETITRVSQCDAQGFGSVSRTAENRSPALAGHLD